MTNREINLLDYALAFLIANLDDDDIDRLGDGEVDEAILLEELFYLKEKVNDLSTTI